MFKKTTLALSLLLLSGIMVSAWVIRPVSETHSALISADLPPPIPLREFYANQDGKYGWSLSIDGKKLTWLETRWFKPLLRIKDRESEQITDIRPPEGFLRYTWAADEKTILFTLDATGWENQKIASIDSSNPDAEIKVFDFGESTTSFLYYIPKQYSEKVVIAHNAADPAIFELYNLDLATGETTQFGVQAEGEVRYAIDDSGEIFARTVFPDAKLSNWILQTQNDEQQWENVAQGDYNDVLFTGGRPDENGILDALSNRTTDRTSVVKFNLKNGGETVVYSDPNVDINRFFLDPVSNDLLAAVSYPGFQKIHFFDEEFERSLSTIDRPKESALHINTITEDAGKILLNIETAEAGFETVLFDRETQNVEIISQPPIAKFSDRLSPVEPVSITAKDGLEFQAFLSRPKGVNGPAPMVIMVHGGPRLSVGWGYNTLRALLNNRGYAVLDVNYRGSTGYGRKFAEAAKGEIAGKMSSDVIDARAWAVESGIADPDSVAIFGGSWGGFEVLTALTQNSKLFAAGVSINGVADLSTMLDEVPDHWRGWREWLVEYGADPETEEGRRQLLEKSPITHAGKVTSPLLLVQGANDSRVVQGQSDRMVEKLREANAPVEYHLYEGVGHSLGSWPWQKRYLLIREIEYFLAEHLGGRTGGYDYALLGAYVLPE